MTSLITINGKYSFKVGENFNSYEELKERMENHTKESCVYYWRRDSRTVEGAFMKTARPISKELKYYSVRYACIYGGQKFASRGFGRRQSQTIRTNCPAFVLLRASKNGQKLEVISVCNDHNHDMSENVYRTLPQNRKLPLSIKHEIQALLQMHIDKNILIEYIKLKTNKELTVKDLFNLAGAYKGPKIKIDNETVNNVLQIVKNFINENKTNISKDETTSLAAENCTIGQKSLTLPDPDDTMKISLDIKLDRENEVFLYEDESGNLIEYTFPNKGDEQLEMSIKNNLITSDNCLSSKIYDRTEVIEESEKIVKPELDETDCNYHSHLMNVSNPVIEDEPSEENNIGSGVEDEEFVVVLYNINNDDDVKLGNDTISENIAASNDDVLPSGPCDIYDENYLKQVTFGQLIMNNEKYEDVQYLLSNSTTHDNAINIDEEEFKEEKDATTEVIFEFTNQSKPNIEVESDFQNEIMKTKRVNKRKNRILLANKKTRWRTLNCRSCGTNTRLLHMQIKLMKAQKRKLMEETEILRLHKKQLLSDMQKSLSNYYNE